MGSKRKPAIRNASPTSLRLLRTPVNARVFNGYSLSHFLSGTVMRCGRVIDRTLHWVFRAELRSAAETGNSEEMV